MSYWCRKLILCGNYFTISSYCTYDTKHPSGRPCGGSTQATSIKISYNGTTISAVYSPLKHNIRRRWLYCRTYILGLASSYSKRKTILRCNTVQNLHHVFRTTHLLVLRPKQNSCRPWHRCLYEYKTQQLFIKFFFASFILSFTHYITST